MGLDPGLLAAFCRLAVLGPVDLQDKVVVTVAVDLVDGVLCVLPKKKK